MEISLGSGKKGLLRYQAEKLGPQPVKEVIDSIIYVSCPKRKLLIV